jgi:hypothetical protein
LRRISLYYYETLSKVREEVVGIQKLELELKVPELPDLRESLKEKTRQSGVGNRKEGVVERSGASLLQ